MGDPVSHSLSPEIHRALLYEAGLRGQYRALTTTREELPERFDEARSGAFHGFNITMPLKEYAAQYVDRIDSVARSAGSVNTVAAEGGQLVGYSTDATAVAGILAMTGFPDVTGALVLGAGGSARAVIAALRNHLDVLITARNEVRARDVAGAFDVGWLAWGDSFDRSLVVNCTPLGMRGESLPDQVVTSALALIDLPYGETQTPAVAAAQRAGLFCVDGKRFLSYQAVDSFRIWTGVDVDPSVLESTLRID